MNELIGVYSGWAALVWILFIASSAFIITRCVGYKRLNTFSIFLPLLVLAYGIFVPFTRNLNAVLTQHPISDEAFRAYWISVGLLYLGLPIGIIIANSFRRNEARHHRFLSLPRSPGACIGAMLVVMAISLISLIQIYRAGIQLDLLPFFFGFRDYSQYSEHRYSFAAATKGASYFIYNKLPYSIAPIVVILIWNWIRLPAVLKFIFLALLTFALVQTGHKLPLVFMALTLVISRFAVRNNLWVSARFYILMTTFGALVIFAILPGFYLLQGEPTYTGALWWSVERVCGESYRALQLHFEVFPNFHPFLHGASQRTIAALVGVKDFIDVSTYIPTEFLGIDNTSYPTLFIGEAWADFGFFGVAFYSVVCGFMLQAYNVWYYNESVHYLEETALFLAVIVSTVHLMSSNLITSCSTYGIGTAGVIYLIIRYCRFRRHSTHASFSNEKVTLND